MPVTKLSRKIALMIFGLALTLILLEGGLRLAGSILLTLQDNKNRSHSNGEEYRILCIGESTTFLGGEDAYPPQLERILNQRGSTRSFKVINKGVPGIDSRFIAANLPAWIAEYRPDMVIAMVGINDPDILRGETNSDTGRPFWRDLRVVTLINLLRAHLTVDDKKPPSPPPHLRNYIEIAHDELRQDPAGRKLYTAALKLEHREEFLKARLVLEQILKKNPPPHARRHLLKKIGDLLVREKNYDQLLGLIRIKWHMRPEDPDAAEWVSHLLEQKAHLPQLTNLIHRHLKTRPDNIALMDYLAAVHMQQNNDEALRDIRQRITTLRSQSISSFTRHFYKQILETLSEHSLRVVLVQYPMRDLALLKAIVESEEPLENMIWVDNRERFQIAVREKGFSHYFTDHFAGDFGHATPAGNRLLAENIADSILNNLD